MRVSIREHAGMDLRPGIGVADEVLSAFVTRNGVRRLAAFGSVLGDDFGDDSDVDLLVEFEPDRVPGLLAIAALEIELGEMFGRQVELRTAGDLSRYFRDQVVAAARELYAA